MLCVVNVVVVVAVAAVLDVCWLCVFVDMFVYVLVLIATGHVIFNISSHCRKMAKTSCLRWETKMTDFELFACPPCTASNSKTNAIDDTFLYCSECWGILFGFRHRGGVTLDQLLRCGAVGRLYRWAQHLAGLEYLPGEKVGLFKNIVDILNWFWSAQKTVHSIPNAMRSSSCAVCAFCLLFGGWIALLLLKFSSSKFCDLEIWQFFGRPLRIRVLQQNLCCTIFCWLFFFLPGKWQGSLIGWMEWHLEDNYRLLLTCSAFLFFFFFVLDLSTFCIVFNILGKLGKLLLLLLSLSPRLF